MSFYTDILDNLSSGPVAEKLTRRERAELLNEIQHSLQWYSIKELEEDTEEDRIKVIEEDLLRTEFFNDKQKLKYYNK